MIKALTYPCLCCRRPQERGAAATPSDEEVRSQIAKEIELEHNTQKAPEQVSRRMMFPRSHLSLTHSAARERATSLTHRAPVSFLQALKNRLLFHLAHKIDDQDKLMMRHQALTDTQEDQLSLAAIHYLRSHFQEATDIYKRLLLENRDDLALNVYVSMCYYKLDYYDVSLEILAVYLQAHPDSAVAVNLKACNHFRLYNGRAAEQELKVLSDQGHNLQVHTHPPPLPPVCRCDLNTCMPRSCSLVYRALQNNDLIRHNMVVFSQGESALQVPFPPLQTTPLSLSCCHAPATYILRPGPCPWRPTGSAPTSGFHSGGTAQSCHLLSSPRWHPSSPLPHPYSLGAPAHPATRLLAPVFSSSL